MSKRKKKCTFALIPQKTGSFGRNSTEIYNFMILNYIWIGFILIAFVVSCIQFFVTGNSNIFMEVMQSAFGSAKTGLGNLQSYGLNKPETPIRKYYMETLYEFSA